MDEYAKAFKEIIDKVKEDKILCKRFYEDLMDIYPTVKEKGDVNEILKVQGVILQYRDYWTQKDSQIADLEQQMRDYTENQR